MVNYINNFNKQVLEAVGRKPWEVKEIWLSKELYNQFPMAENFFISGSEAFLVTPEHHQEGVHTIRIPIKIVPDVDIAVENMFTNDGRGFDIVWKPPFKTAMALPRPGVYTIMDELPPGVYVDGDYHEDINQEGAGEDMNKKINVAGIKINGKAYPQFHGVLDTSKAIVSPVEQFIAGGFLSHKVYTPELFLTLYEDFNKLLPAGIDSETNLMNFFNLNVLTERLTSKAPIALSIEGSCVERPWETFKGEFLMQYFEPENPAAGMYLDCQDFNFIINEELIPKYAPILSEEDMSLVVAGMLRMEQDKVVSENTREHAKRIKSRLQEALKKGE